MDPDATSFTYTECHEAFSGALALLKTAWVNPPHLDERAHHKPLQLATAAEVGLCVPRGYAGAAVISMEDPLALENERWLPFTGAAMRRLRTSLEIFRIKRYERRHAERFDRNLLINAADMAAYQRVNHNLIGTFAHLFKFKGVLIRQRLLKDNTFEDAIVVKTEVAIAAVQPLTRIGNPRHR